MASWLERVDPDPAKRAPGRKDRRHFCKGKRDREHTPAVTMKPQPFYTGVVGGECGWIPEWNRRDRTWAGARWSCRHDETCTECGKILRTVLEPGECPSYPGRLEQRAAAEGEAASMQERRDDWYRRPVIDGPQGYRRKRGA